MGNIFKTDGFLRSGLLVIGLALFFGVFAAADTKAQGPLGQILNRMDAYNKALSSLRADITMVKTDAGLGVSDTTIGNTTYLPKTVKPKRVMYVRIDWTKPQQEQIVVIGDDYKLYRPTLNIAYEGKTDQAQNNAKAGGAFAFISMSKEQRKTNYDVVYIGEETISGSTRTWHLQLTPKVATSYKLADVWVNGDGFPQQAKVTEKNNDTTTILLTNIQPNIKIDRASFVLTYSKGTKVHKV